MDVERCFVCQKALHENEQGDLVCLSCRGASFKAASTRDAHEYEGDWECFGCADPQSSVSSEDQSPAVLLVYQTETRGEVALWLCEVCWSEGGIEDASTINDLMEQLPMAPR